MGNNFCGCSDGCRAVHLKKKYCSCVHSGPNKHKCLGPLIKARDVLDNFYMRGDLYTRNEKVIRAINDIINFFYKDKCDTGKFKINNMYFVNYNLGAWRNRLDDRYYIQVYQWVK